MKKRPKQYKTPIGVFKIKYLNKVGTKKEDLFGQFRVRSSVIEINATLEHQITAQTLVHELIHAMLIQSDLDLGKQTEMFTSALTTHLTYFIRNNKEFIKYIQSSK